MNYDLRKQYYNIIPVKYELLKAFRGREVVFMSDSDHSKCIRGLFINNIPFLNKVFEFYHFLEKDYNIYTGLARFSKIPVFPWDLKLRSEKTGEFFNKGIYEVVVEYDLLMDFDIEKSKYTAQQLSSIVNLFLNYGLKFNFYPSGTGFQLILYSENFDFIKDFNIDNEKNYLNCVKYLLELLITRFNLSALDVSGIGAIAKIRKCEYSVCNDIIVLPLNRQKYIKDYSRFKLPRVISETIFRNRGLMIFNEYNTNIKINFQKFLKDFLIYEDLKKWQKNSDIIIKA